MRRQVAPQALRDIVAVEQRDLYVYDLSALALAAAGTASDSINIDTGSSFVLQKLTFFADIAAAAQTESTRIIPLVKIQLTDSGSGRRLFNSELPIPLIFGTGEIPYILPVQRVFAGGSVISASFTNYAAATTYNIYLALHGARVYR